MDVDCAYTRLHENNTFDPKDHQTCVVIYDEFKNGVSTIPVGIGKRFEPEKLSYILKSIGHSDDGDLWEMTTNQSLFLEDLMKTKKEILQRLILNFISMVLTMMVKFLS